MKKILIGIIAVVVVVVTAIAAGVALFLDSGIKRGVETLGPQLTKVDVKLDGVSVSLLSGSGKIKGSVVDNPAGYQTGPSFPTRSPSSPSAWSLPTSIAKAAWTATTCAPF